MLYEIITSSSTIFYSLDNMYSFSLGELVVWLALLGRAFMRPVPRKWKEMLEMGALNAWSLNEFDHLKGQQFFLVLRCLHLGYQPFLLSQYGGCLADVLLF